LIFPEIQTMGRLVAGFGKLASLAREFGLMELMDYVSVGDFGY